MVRAPEIRLAHSCGSLVNCAAEHSVNIFPDKTELKTHVQKFKRRDLKKSEDKKRERAEQRIIDLLTVKGIFHPNSIQISSEFQPNFDRISSEFQPNFNRISPEFHPNFTRLKEILAALSVLRESCWYWGNISGEKAKNLLNGASPGTFLIRDSSDRR